MARLLGRALSATPPADGQVLTWNAAANEWQAKAPGGGGGGNTVDHGSLAGLADDDHTQYVLADGVRNSVNGFAVTGQFNTGSIPVSGPGARLMWYPRKAAFRAGWVVASHWDDAQIGDYSVAMGINTVASGWGSVALGIAAGAVGERSVALAGGYATGHMSFAVGGAAAGQYSVAMGQITTASGDRSMALGSSVDTNDKIGTFVWGDASHQGYTDRLLATSNNQFVVRASRIWLGNDNNVTASFGRYLETSTGAFLSSGGTWTNSSDAAKKTGFESIDGETILAKLGAMPVSTWSYREEDVSIRHMGPTAQDFSAAFALGSTDKAIATVDADGVSLAAIKALIERTDALRSENERLRADNDDLRGLIESLRLRVKQLATIDAATPRSR